MIALSCFLFTFVCLAQSRRYYGKYGYGKQETSSPEPECKTKTTNGKCCSLPFTYKGVTYNSCTKVDHNQLWCSLDTYYRGRWGNCAETSSPEPECKTKTTNGKCCSLPFTYKGVTYNSCTKVDHNQLWCSLDTYYRGRWGNCAEPECKTKTTNDKCCSLPFTYKGVTYNSCTKVDHNQLWCSLDTYYRGRWGNCEPECKTKTTNDKCCSLPFTYKGVRYNSCTKVDHNQLWCSLDTYYRGRWGNCEPECKTKTTNDKCCSLPFTYKGVTYNSCTKVDHNQLWCSLDTYYRGRWGNCEPECKTKTTNGKCCSLPFTYKGVTYNSCTKVDHNQLWCSLDTYYRGRWGNCEPECKTKTTNGKCCSLPFTYKGVTYNSCTKVDHNQLWCSLDTYYRGRWGNCETSSPEPECKTKTTNGKCCSLPFTYKGVTYNSCTKVDHNQLWCSLDTYYRGRWGNCEPECKTKTTNGKCCSLPFTYKGVTYNSCTKVDHNQLWCSLDTYYRGRWGNCEPECKTKTTNGKCCSLPFTYKGVTYNSCTKVDHNQLWCSLDTYYRGRWGNCEPECKTKTTNGKCCSLPFTYKGVTYNSCTKVDHNQLWCSLDTYYRGRWGNCGTSCEEGSTSYDECRQRCTCVGGKLVNCVRIRKEFTLLTDAEKKNHIGIILKVSAIGSPYRAEYEQLINEHYEKFDTSIHKPEHFLPWHRYYILRYENLMRKADCTFTATYWDWSLDTREPFSTAPNSVWNSDTGFGGDGEDDQNCVLDGPFKKGAWSRVRPDNARRGTDCVMRDFNGDPPTEEDVLVVLNMDNFTKFERALREALHDNVHCQIGATMCTQEAASAPEFFLHHAFIDKIWDDRQKKSKAHKCSYFQSVGGNMPGTNLTPDQLIDLSNQPGGVIVEYEPFKQQEEIRKKVESLSPNQLRHYPRRRFTGLSLQAIRLFKISSAEVKKIRELEKWLDPNVMQP
ncbi:uncharacterized protein [Montipora capricornis]|uniref:uncharacterized protein isoform X4 n=1 Tax=Montipora capricornis TaxID=246305 RepID=UPI0035F12D63